MTVSDVLTVLVAFDEPLAVIFGCLLFVYLADRIVRWFRGVGGGDVR